MKLVFGKLKYQVRANAVALIALQDELTHNNKDITQLQYHDAFKLEK